MLLSKQIVLALEGGPHCGDAINRARLLALNTDCELVLLWFGTKPAWESLESDIKALEKECAVRRIVSDQELPQMVQKLWQEVHFALFVKGCDLQHSKPSLLTPFDWQLLRDTPCPMLLVKRPGPWSGGRILAAINPLSSKEHQLQHDQNVLKMTAFIAQEAKAEWQVVVAVSSQMQAADKELQVPVLLQQHARSAAGLMMEEMDVRPDRVNITEGPAEYGIARVASEEDAALVVISTRARRGIAGALLGNTAEQILDRLDTDVMVLRPD